MLSKIKIPSRVVLLSLFFSTFLAMLFLPNGVSAVCHVFSGPIFGGPPIVAGVSYYIDPTFLTEAEVIFDPGYVTRTINQKGFEPKQPFKPFDQIAIRYETREILASECNTEVGYSDIFVPKWILTLEDSSDKVYGSLEINNLPGFTPSSTDFYSIDPTIHYYYDDFSMMYRGSISFYLTVAPTGIIKDASTFDEFLDAINAGESFKFVIKPYWYPGEGISIFDGDTVTPPFEVAEDPFFGFKHKEQPDDSLKKEIPLGKLSNCVQLEGSGPRKVVFMRETSVNGTTLEGVNGFINNSNGVIQGGFGGVDPFATYFDQFSFFVDLHKKSERPDNRNAASAISSCKGADLYLNYMNNSLIGSPNFGVVLMGIEPFNTTQGLFNYFQNTPMVEMHETGHALGGLLDEYIYSEFGSPSNYQYRYRYPFGKNCTRWPPRDYHNSIDNKMYGARHVEGCTYMYRPGAPKEFDPRPYYRPSVNGIMNTTLDVPDSNYRFNIISCGYLVSAIKGESLVGKTFAQTHWPAVDPSEPGGKGCSAMNTIDSRSPPNPATPTLSPPAGASRSRFLANVLSAISWKSLLAYVSGIPYPMGSFSSYQASQGSEVTIHGTNFTPEDNAVQLANYASGAITEILGISTSDSTTLTFTVPTSTPPGISTIKVGAFNSDWSNTLNFFVGASNLPQVQVTLEVSGDGEVAAVAISDDGRVIVTGNIFCKSFDDDSKTCTVSVAPDTELTLTAVPDTANNYYFTGFNILGKACPTAYSLTCSINTSDIQGPIIAYFQRVYVSAPSIGSFKVSPSVVNSGQTADLSWSAMAAAVFSCELSGDGETKRVGLIKNYYETLPLTTPTTFTLTCTGMNYQQVQKSVTVPGQEVTLQFSSDGGNVTTSIPFICGEPSDDGLKTCIGVALPGTKITFTATPNAGYAWNGFSGFNGGANCPAFSSTCTVTPEDIQGTVFAYFQHVISAPKMGPFYADPSTVNAGQSTALSWSVMPTSAYFCNLSGDGPTKRVNLSSSGNRYETQPLATTTTFTLTCTGMNSTQVSKSATVTVIQPAPLRPTAVEGSVTAPPPTQTTSSSLDSTATSSTSIQSLSSVQVNLFIYDGGNVTTTGATFSCGASSNGYKICLASVVPGTQITLTATPDVNYSFTNFSNLLLTSPFKNSCPINSAVCIITVPNAVSTISARFIVVTRSTPEIGPFDASPIIPPQISSFSASPSSVNSGQTADLSWKTLPTAVFACTLTGDGPVPKSVPISTNYYETQPITTITTFTLTCTGMNAQQVSKSVTVTVNSISFLQSLRASVGDAIRFLFGK